MFYQQQNAPVEDLVLQDGSTPRFERGQMVRAFESGHTGRVKQIKIVQDHFEYTVAVREPFVVRFLDFEEFHLRDHRD